MTLLEKVKLACRVVSTTYDSELQDLILSALGDIGITDVRPELLTMAGTAPMIERAVITYCKMNFGYLMLTGDQYGALKASYDEQKSQLLMSSEFTDWGGANA